MCIPDVSLFPTPTQISEMMTLTMDDPMESGMQPVIPNPCTPPLPPPLPPSPIASDAETEPPENTQQNVDTAAQTADDSGTSSDVEEVSVQNKPGQRLTALEENSLLAEVKAKNAHLAERGEMGTAFANVKTA